jgi:hypothetical protein
LRYVAGPRAEQFIGPNSDKEKNSSGVNVE